MGECAVHADRPGFGLNLAAVLAGILLVGYVDFATGHDLGFFVFYFAPVGFAGWRLGMRLGIGMAIAGAVIWALADRYSGYQYSSLMFPVWNAIIRLAAFLIVAIGCTILRRAYETQKAIAGDLARALSQVKTLEGLLPICASCKKIRDEQGSWQVLESYIGKHAGVQFSHGVCPECAQAMLKEAGLPEDYLEQHRGKRD